jgi:hypothetical protein
VIPEILLLVEQIRPRTSQIDNFRTSISVFLQPRTFKAVEGVRDALTTADDTLILVVAERAFVADTGKGGWSYVGVADGAFAVAFVAEAADGYTGGFAAHNEIAGKLLAYVHLKKELRS